MSARTREMFGLVPVALIVSAGFAAVLVSRNDAQAETGLQQIKAGTLTYGLVFLGLCVAAHIFLRIRLPDADPYLLPLAAVLAGFGLVEIYRIDPEQARAQAQWFVGGLIVFSATIIVLRDHAVLERYRYTIAAAGIVLLLLPRVPGLGAQTNGAYLGVSVGPIDFQPAEFAKIAIIVFLASYLRDTGDVLVRKRNAPLTLPQQVLSLAVPAALVVLVIVAAGLGPAEIVLLVIFVASLVAILRERPSLKHFGPLLLVWGLAMFMLLFIRDLGSSVMFFGGFLALLYMATGRLSLVGIGATMFLGGATYFANTVGHVQDRVEVWQHPFRTELFDRASGGSYQIAQGLFAQADGGLFGQGFGQALLRAPGAKQPIVPLADTDLIYALIVNEAGLFGAAALILVYLLFVGRGFKTAMIAPDGFSKLLAAGLTAVFALQVFVIVGGVTKAIPLTGVTLPFVSYGGSSIVANMMLLALLLVVSDHARRDRRSQRGGLV